MTVNINAEIETIRNAPYARDVRDAIADSLKQMMDVAGNEAKFESYVTAVTDQFLQDHPDAVAPTDEQVKAWCDANGVTTGATAEEAAQIQQNAAAVTSLKSDLSQLSDEIENIQGTGGGFSSTLRAAMYNLLMDAAYQSSDHASDKAALEELLTGSSGGGEGVTYYIIKKDLTNVSIDNGASSVAAGSTYNATLTAEEGYTLDSISVTMGGDAIEVADGVISIEAVTGNIVITASAAKIGTADEVTLLKSITGDGASYIDTGIIMADIGADVQIELSAKLASENDQPVFFGADMWNLYSNYGRVYANKNTMYCQLNNGTGQNYPTSQDGNGFWNDTAVPNLYSEQRWYKYVVSVDGTLAATYMDEDMTTIPSSANETMTAFTNYDADTIANSLPIIPIHIFASNVSDSASYAGKGYDTPGTFTLYYFRIKKYSTGEILHEYIPAKRGVEIGMYDNVTDTFLPNAGNGTFNYEEVPA